MFGRTKWWFLIIAIWIGLTSYSQSTKEELFEDGNYFFNSEDYNEAIFYFLELIKIDPLNPHFNYKAGACLIHIPGREQEAIPYLEQCQPFIDLKFKKNSIEEHGAPLHAMFYLGNAYRMNNQLNEALALYEKFIMVPNVYDLYNYNVIQQEIKNCERAKTILDQPVEVTFANLGRPVNNEAANLHPVVSGDGKVMAYISRLKFYDAIMVSYHSGNTWTTPENINPSIVSDGDYIPSGLSSDGKTMLLTRKVKYNTDIYISFYQNDRWTPAVPLEGINTPTDETDAGFSPDMNSVVFASNRKGGEGGYDLYRIGFNGKTAPGKPENLGKIINTTEDERFPVLTNQGKAITFSSKGHYNMGGFDIFYSLTDTDWRIPVNMGYPVNTTSDNLGFQSLGAPFKGFISLRRADGYGQDDIYWIEVLTPMQKTITESRNNQTLPKP